MSYHIISHHFILYDIKIRYTISYRIKQLRSYHILNHITSYPIISYLLLSQWGIVASHHMCYHLSNFVNQLGQNTPCLWWNTGGFLQQGFKFNHVDGKLQHKRSYFPHFHWRLIQHLESQGKCTVKCFLQTTHIHIYTSVAKCFEGSEQSTYSKAIPFINRQQIPKPFKVQSHQQQRLSISKYMM